MKRKSRALSVLLVFLAILLVTALLPAPVPVVDLVTGRAVAGARLTPVDPRLRDALEPVFGPVHLLSRLPDLRLFALIVWTALAGYLVRVVRRSRPGGLGRRLVRELWFLLGLYVPLAILPLPFIWTGILPRGWQRALTPVGLPGLVFVVLLVRVLRSPAARHRRGRAAAGLVARFFGVPGFLALGFFFVIFLLPGVWRTGLKLVPPPGKIVMDLHAHAQKSQDALVGGVERLDIFRMQGVKISAVTEHNRFFDPEEPNEDTYATMLAPARERGIVLLPGEELTTHAVHLTLLGVKRTYNPSRYRTKGEKDRPPDFGYDYRRVIADVHRAGGHVVVAHWGTIRMYDRIPWRTLVDWGVDGFEIATSADRATPEQLAAWKATGLLLVAGTDFHGWRKSLYCWNLIDPDEVSGDPYETLDRIFADHRLQVVAAGTFDPRVPAWLDPPVSLYRYFTGMRPGGRLSWALLALLAWLLARLAERRRGPRHPEPGGGGRGHVVGPPSAQISGTARPDP